MEDVLYKSKDMVYIFKQGAEKPIITHIYNLKEHRSYPLLNDNWHCEKDIKIDYEYEREECL